jgi:hypothetical protein
MAQFKKSRHNRTNMPKRISPNELNIIIEAVAASQTVLELKKFKEHWKKKCRVILCNDG